MSLNYNNFLNDFDKLFFPVNKNFKNDFEYKSTLGYGQNHANIYTDGTNSAFIEICLPGYSKSDIDVSTSKNTLIISSDVNDKEYSDRNYVQRQFQKTSFKKVWSFPSNYNLNAVEADYNGGILTLSIPVYSENVSETRKIEIN